MITQDLCACGQPRDAHTTPHPFVGVVSSIDRAAALQRITDQCLRSMRNVGATKEELKRAALGLIGRLREEVLDGDTSSSNHHVL